MAALEETKGGDCKDDNTVKCSSRPASERTVGTFEEISVPGCNVQFKEEVDETQAVAEAPVLEQDPLQIEEEVPTGNAPHSERSVQNLKPECSTSTGGGVWRTVVCSAASSLDHLPRGQGLSSRDSTPHFSCSSCGRTFSSKYALLMHVFIHVDGVEPPPNVCRLCCEVFPTLRYLHEHLKGNQCAVTKTPHRFLGTNNEKRSCRKLQWMHYPRDRPENLSLRSAGDTFHKTKTDISHAKSCDFDSCNDGFQKSISTDVTLCTGKQIQIGEETNACQISDKSFTSTAHVKPQDLVHPHRRPYRCYDCGISFKYQFSLDWHTSLHTDHSNRSGNCGCVCSECGKSFKVIAHLRRHMKMHDSKKPHTCAVCFKSFMTRSSLKVHSIVHIGGRSHRCDICYNYFLNSRDLQQHVRVHIL